MMDIFYQLFKFFNLPALKRWLSLVYPFLYLMSSSAKPLLERETYKSKLTISLIVWNISLSSFYFGYCVVCLGQIKTETLQDLFSIDMPVGTTEGILNGCIPIGALIGSLSSSFLIAQFSRRKCLLMMNIFAFIVGALIFIQNFHSLGFCVGFYSTVAPLIIKELSPTEISGALGSYAPLNICIGIFTGCILTYTLKKATGDETCKDFWSIILGLPQITLAIQTAILIIIFPYETPRYLLSIGEEEQAKRLIQVIYKEEYVLEILEEKKGDLNFESVLSQKSETSNSSSGAAIIVAIHLAIMQQFSGVIGVIVYGGKIAGKATGGELELLMPSIINCQQMLATVAASYLLTKLGRRPILLYGVLAVGIACVLVMIGFFVKGNNNGSGDVLILAGLLMFMAVFGISLGPVVWLYIPEIVQARVVPYSTASNWISASLVVIFFPIMTEDVLDGNPGVLFIFFTAWCICSFVFNYFFVLETKDKNEKTIREEYLKVKLCR